jgi:hypothetical protein
MLQVAEEAEQSDAVHAWKLLAVLLETEADLARKQSELVLPLSLSKEAREGFQQILKQPQLRLPSSAKSVPDRTDLVDPLRTPGLSALKALLPMEPITTPLILDVPLLTEQTGDNTSSGSATPPATLSVSMHQKRGLHPTHIEEIRTKLLQGVGSPLPDPAKLIHQREDGDSESDEDDERLSSSILASTLTRKSRPQFMSPPLDVEGNSMRRVSPAQMMRLGRRRSSGRSIPDHLKRRLAGKAQAQPSEEEPENLWKAAVEGWLQILRKMLKEAFEKAIVEVSGREITCSSLATDHGDYFTGRYPTCVFHALCVTDMFRCQRAKANENRGLVYRHARPASLSCYLCRHTIKARFSQAGHLGTDFDGREMSKRHN